MIIQYVVIKESIIIIFNHIIKMKKIHLLFMLTVIFMTASNTMAQEKLPSQQERVYALSQIWKELHYNFAFPETLRKVNIDSLYLAYLPKMEHTENYYVYYRTLSSFIAHFNDAHTRIIASRRPDDIPPLNVINFGQKVIVSNIAKNLSERIPVGSEIIKVNQVAVVEYLKDSIYQFITASTPHWKFDKAVNEMFYGVPQSVVNVTIKTPKGKEREVDLIRNYYSDGAKERLVDSTIVPSISIKIIDKNIGYIKLSSFSVEYRDTINKVFNNYLPQLRKCKGLIIDIRGNRGGTEKSYVDILNYLISELQFQTKGKWFTRKHVTNYMMRGEYDSRFRDYYHGTAMEEIKYVPYKNPVTDSLKLHQPLVVVSGKFVGSASEVFLQMIRHNNRGTIIGGPSVGAVSEPMIFSIPGDLEVMLCAKKCVNPDGTQPDDTGILPDIEVKEDYNAYLKGKDNVLERAIEELKKKI